eukprot:TRINITY_DN1781_c0_g1_i3.p1 TRINITY_DN1781_c0_g1~~TRINITY_DN1781_c0_g1_i3.p1  ORF type:complete len:400 (-),score=104.34 TRINITY_DN1781_c0_g1_i3:201-1244(-)
MSVSRSIFSSRNLRLVSQSARLAPCVTKYNYLTSENISNQPRKVQHNTEPDEDSHEPHGSDNPPSLHIVHSQPTLSFPKFNFSSSSARLSPSLNKHDYHVRSFSTTSNTKAVKKQSELALTEKKLANLAEKEISFMNEYLQTYSEEEGSQDFEKDSQAFFDNTGFSLTVDEETENIVLTKKTEGKTLTFVFSKNEAPQSEDDLLDQNDEPMEGEGADPNVVEGEATGQESEYGNENESGMGPSFSREHPFSVTLTSDKHPDIKIHFGCFGADDGNFLISTLNTEENEKVSLDVTVGDLTEEYQQGLLQYFRNLGVNEEVVTYMFKYIDQKRFESNVNSMNVFKAFLK